MNTGIRVLNKLWPLLMAVALVLPPVTGNAEDIDIFVAGAGGGGAANVLVVIDNTSNWASAKQAWPAEECDPVAMPGVVMQYQGQAEICALIKLIPTLNDSVRLGLMLLTQNGSGNCCNGGYIRYAMRPMTPANRVDLVTNYLKPLLINFLANSNKAASSASYSGALFDAYKYFGGWASPDPTTWPPGGSPQDATHFGLDVWATPASALPVPDPAGYTDSSYRTYVPPPASAADECGGKDYIVFIGNGPPNTDTLPQENLKTILEGVGGISTQIPMPVLTTITTTTTSNLGPSAACYTKNANGLKACNTDVALTCDPSFDTCTCGNPTTACNGGKVKYTVTGTLTTTVAVPTGQTAVPTGNRIRYADEWTRFLHTADVSDAGGQQAVTTFTIDVFNAKQDADETALLYSMASAGGGQYYAAKNRNNLEFALGDIFAKIQAANSVFASASLPVNATNRAVTANQVYLGMFRPDPDARPLWYGNLKRYKIGKFAGSYDLADASGAGAVNPLTGFLGDCATSFWTTDSGQYWAGISSNPPPFGKCPVSAANPFSPYSDTPDGPLVEKGGVAEVIRKGNTVASDWALHRTLKTQGSLDFNTTNVPSLAQADVDFVSGLNVDADGNYLQYNFDPSDPTKTTNLRATLHGDVVHSRPRAINYPSGQTVVYYGANDGWLRAADSASGKEIWGYMAEEFYSTLPRLRKNSPLISYSFITQQSISPAPEPKNYYFDGAIGAYQSSDSSDVRILPTMRRGGRMLYSFDVHAPASPSLMWKKGCPSLTSDAGCSSGFDGIGQTWSMPRAAKLMIDSSGNVSSTPMLVVAVGGGYDKCEDGSPDNACVGGKGSVVYVLNAADGAILRPFSTVTTDAGTNPTPGRVVADVAYVDLDGDHIPDFAYVVDTRGNIYRIGFVDPSLGMSSNASARLAATSWTWTLVAYTSGADRKFLYAPALYTPPGGNFVYLALGTGDREQPLITQYPCGGSAAPPAACGSVSTPVLNRFYVYLDDVSGTAATNLDDTTSLCNFTDAITRAQCTTLTPATDVCSNAVVIPGSGKSGWFMDLKAACESNSLGCGEQTVTSAVIIGGPTVAFSTNRPVPAVANACAPFGEARGYAVNLLSGSGVIGAQPNYCGGSPSDIFVGGGLPPSPVVANVDVDGTVVNIGIGIVSLNGGPNSPIDPQKIFTLSPQARKRIYWRQEGGN